MPDLCDAASTRQPSRGVRVIWTTVPRKEAAIHPTDATAGGAERLRIQSAAATTQAPGRVVAEDTVGEVHTRRVEESQRPAGIASDVACELTPHETQLTRQCLAVLSAERHRTTSHAPVAPVSAEVAVRDAQAHTPARRQRRTHSLPQADCTARAPGVPLGDVEEVVVEATPVQVQAGALADADGGGGEIVEDARPRSHRDRTADQQARFAVLQRQPCQPQLRAATTACHVQEKAGAPTVEHCPLAGCGEGEVLSGSQRDADAAIARARILPSRREQDFCSFVRRHRVGNRGKDTRIRLVR